MKERAFWAQDLTRWGEDPRALLGIRASRRGHLEARLSEVCAPIGQRGCISQAKPSQTECQTEGNRDLYLDNRGRVPNTKPSQTERQTEPLAICIWTFHGAALTSIIILRRKEGCTKPARPGHIQLHFRILKEGGISKKSARFSEEILAHCCRGWRWTVDPGTVCPVMRPALPIVTLRGA